MKKWLSIGISAVVGASAALAVTSASAAPTQFNRFYIAPMGNYTISDHRRDAGNGWGGSLALGKQINRYLNLEAGFYLHGLRQKKFANAPDWEIHGFDVNGLVFMDRNPVFAPFIRLGVGAIRNQGANVASSTDVSYNAGLGFTHQLTSGGIEFRASAVWRYSRYTPGIAGHKHLNDYEFNAGLVIPFGGTQQPQPLPVPVVAAPEDSDHDGVPNSKDQCPNTPAGVAVDARGCALDSDHDGVPNYRDRCPHTRPDTKVNKYGCAVLQPFELHVNYPVNSAKLTGADAERLERAIPRINRTLKLYPNSHLEIGGYTDSTGRAAYNQQLSQRRSQSVVSYLENHGVDGSRLVAHGYGEQYPVAPNDTASGRARNRRTEVRVLAH